MHYLGLLVRRSGFRLCYGYYSNRVPCVCDMVGVMNASPNGNHDVTKNGGLEIIEA